MSICKKSNTKLLAKKKMCGAVSVLVVLVVMVVVVV
jgi:hypothetical protein